jgi:CelD/BcsL family acetyltransferase involved in cellulose biosynthesis
MDLLEGFIRQRFSQRTSKHAALNRWQHYKTSVYREVNAGNAAIFVLEEKQNPIAISVSYLFDEIMFAALASFDQNYYRYSLGRQMFYHQIEWCYEKEYQLLDLGWGAFDYKVKFSNAVYTYQTHAIYPKSNIIAKVLAFCALQFIKLKYYLVMLRDRQFSSPKKTYRGRWLSYQLIKNNP